MWSFNHGESQRIDWPKTFNEALCCASVNKLRWTRPSLDLLLKIAVALDYKTYTVLMCVRKEYVTAEL